MSENALLRHGSAEDLWRHQSGLHLRHHNVNRQIKSNGFLNPQGKVLVCTSKRVIKQLKFVTFSREVILHNSIPGQTYNTPFDKCRTNEQRLRSPPAHGRFDGFGTKGKEQKKRLVDRMTNFINCDQVCFHKSKGKWTSRQSSGLCGRSPKAF